MATSDRSGAAIRRWQCHPVGVLAMFYECLTVGLHPRLSNVTPLGFWGDLILKSCVDTDGAALFCSRLLSFDL